MKSNQILPPKAIKEFQNLYKNRFGERLPNTKAAIRATDFLNFFNQITTTTGVKIHD